MGGDPWRVAAGPHLAIMAELLGELRRGGLNLNVRNPNELAEELVVNWEGTKLWVGRSREGQYFGTDQYGWARIMEIVDGIAPEVGYPFDMGVMLLGGQVIDCSLGSLGGEDD